MTDIPADLREPDNPAAAALAQHIADHPMSTIQAAFRILGMQMTVEVRDANASPLARLRAWLVADRDSAARNATLARREQTRHVNDGTVAGLDSAIRLLDAALGGAGGPHETGDRSALGPRAGDPSAAGHSPADLSDGGAS